MGDPDHGSVTQLLEAVGKGDGAANERLWRLLHTELHRLASRQLAREGPGAMQTTSLIQEAFIKLTDGQPVQFSNRRHFFGAAANVMRQIRIDDARTRKRLKRGGGHRPIPLDREPAVNEPDPAEILAINELVDRLAAMDPRKAEVVKFRYFAGLSVDETAEAMGISPRTVDSEWQFAKAWLHREMKKGSDSGEKGQD